VFQRFTAVVCLVAAASSAEPARVHLDYQPPEPSCPSRTFLTGQVERRLGRPVFTAAPEADLVLVIEVSGGRFKTSLTLTDRDGHALGERVLEPSSGRCDELAESLPVVVSLLVNVPGRVLPKPRAPEPPKEASGKREQRVSAAVVTAVGVSAAASVGVSGERTLVLGMLRLELGASVLFPLVSPLGEGPTVRVGVATLVARGCLAFEVGRFEVGPCVSAEAGVAWSNGIGLTTAEVQVRPFVAAVPGGAATLLVAPSLRLRLDLGALLPLSSFRYTFVSGGSTQVAWQAWVVSPWARLGVAVSF
jgi:hypothetical protein